VPDQKTEKKITLTVPLQFTHEQVRDLLCCGLESGHVGSFEIHGYYEKHDDPKQPNNWKKIDDEDASSRWEFPHLDAPFDNCAIAMKDKYGDSNKILLLHFASMVNGLVVMAKKAPHQFGLFVQDGGDAITGDAFVQCALLGDVVYG